MAGKDRDEAEQAPLRALRGSLPGEEHRDVPERDEMLRGREQEAGSKKGLGSRARAARCDQASTMSPQDESGLASMTTGWSG